MLFQKYDKVACELIQLGLYTRTEYLDPTVSSGSLTTVIWQGEKRNPQKLSRNRRLHNELDNDARNR